MDSAVPFSNAVFDVPPFPEQAHIMTVAAAIHTFNILVIIIHFICLQVAKVRKKVEYTKESLKYICFFAHLFVPLHYQR